MFLLGNLAAANEDDSREQEEESNIKGAELIKDDQQEEEEDQELPELHNNRKAGNLVAVYEEQWFLAEVAKDQSKAEKAYVNLSYIMIKGSNCFCDC
jgi:hypothetical protein